VDFLIPGKIRLWGTYLQLSLLNSRRGPRTSFTLGSDKGVYALFLRAGSRLVQVKPGKEGLLYIGLAASGSGLSGRCHFNARTVNHSPRKSLAVLLMAELALNPVLVTKPNSPNTWGLDEASDAKLTAWMHENLLLAVEACDDPDAMETMLVGVHAPPLNLTKCVQSPQHRLISAARKNVMSAVERAGRPGSTVALGPASRHEPVSSSDRPRIRDAKAGAEMDTAEAIAARYGLDPKRFRQRLREKISWYKKPQVWAFPEGSRELRDMIAVAEAMRRV
jgi:hypothetical protein